MGEDTLFHMALDCSTEEQRQALLDEQCGSDVTLRRRIEAMVAASRVPDSLLDNPIQLEQTTAPGSASIAKTGDRIGPYKLLETIGEGGMGIVFVAERQKPVRQRVALKIIKPGMASAEVIARFEAERQALALMDHPNVAKVLDAGTTDIGLPYFAMEHIKGIPITDYCDEKNLSARERLKLFRQVCHGVHHSHQKGIIHRDLKPSNILIAEYDDVASPKIIDFGIAKALNQSLTDRTLYTKRLYIVGTLQYMSPEQAKMNQHDVDIRSDIYSLGVVLYELLTGRPPFERKALEEAGLEGMCKIISEVEPQRPSDRIGTLDAESASQIAQRRSTEISTLGKLIRGDLDWIVLTGLEKDRNRRYESASRMAEDITNYLRHEDVSVSPPTITYRLSKFYRRNRLAVSIAAAALVVLVTCAVISLSGWRAAIEAKNDAIRLSEENSIALRQSDRRLLLLRDVLACLGFTDADSIPSDELEQSTSTFAENRGRVPVSYAYLLRQIGNDYRFKADFENADGCFATSEFLSAHSDFTADQRSWLHLYRGRVRLVFQNYEDALPHYRSAVQVDSEPARNIWFRQEYAFVLMSLGRTSEAKEIYQQVALEIKDYIDDGNFIFYQNEALTFSSYVCWAVMGGEKLDMEAISILQRLIDEGHSGAFVHTAKAMVLEQSGDLESAIASYEAAISQRQFNDPPYDEQLPIDWIESRATELMSELNYEDIESKMVDWNATREAILPADHPNIAFGKIRLANFLIAQGNMSQSVNALLTDAKSILSKHAFTADETIENLENILLRISDSQ